ncbi:DUF4328 domain-containing protein [Streptomyces mangrovisoli]|uniref:DUF4328 domain-containing protein n=1 Tax=Streptomyces mangrovisoli TaxID=1428628 RepID=A0A1J4NKH0_9ACTN|nr:DUF4328 domain-containing protein [Streptomyces mangrovisoli]OIJ62752.1 hypothetical protein WN71_037710 [Streptomyces mangrovisoli]
MNNPAIQSPRLLARLAQVAVAAAAVAEVGRAVYLHQHRLLSGDDSSGEPRLTLLLYSYALMAAIVLFLLWFARCRDNAAALAPESIKGTGFRAVVCWLIPVVNLWMPRQLLLELRRASAAADTAAGRAEAVVNLWWVAWAAHMVLSVALQATGGTSPPLLAAAQVANLAAAALVLWLIEHITGLQSERVAEAPAAEALSEP